MDNEEPTTVYRRWLEEFANKIDSLGPEDYETPFRLTSISLIPFELEGECLEWTRRYLSLHDCPNGLVYQLSRAVYKSFKDSINISRFIIDNGNEESRDEDDEDISDNTSQESSDESDGKTTNPPQLSAGKLLVEVVSHIYQVVKTWNTSPPTLVSPPTSLHVCVHAIKNTRRKMEDRHVTITDLNTLFDIKDCPHQSYFAVFDGHGGIEAADYAAAHLHNYLVADHQFISDPAAALKRAYKTTDLRFLEKAKRMGVRSGSTGVTALVRGDELYIAWLGDSQALLVRAGQPVQIMDPHKPEREDERQRIEELGGCVLFFGAWRVNGNIAVARAIGDAAHKPFISSDADTTCLRMTGEEEYLVLACDGLWDVLTPSQVTDIVYKHSHTSPGGLDDVAIGLVNAARDSGSSDNISVIVVLFKSKLSVPQATTDGGILLGSSNMPENFSDHFSSSTSTGSSVPQPKPPSLNRKLESRGKSDAKDEMFAATRGSVENLTATVQQTPFSHKLMRQNGFYLNDSPRRSKLPRDPNLEQLALRQAVSSAEKNRVSLKHKQQTRSALFITSDGTGNGNAGHFAKRSGRKEIRHPKARSLSRQPIVQKGTNVAHFSKKKKSHGNNVTSFSLSIPGGPGTGETMWGYSDDSDDAWSVSTGLSDADWPPSKRVSMAAVHNNSNNSNQDLAMNSTANVNKKGEPILTPLRLKGSTLLQAAISVESAAAASQWAKNISSSSVQSPFLQLSGQMLQLSNRATLPQIQPCVPATPHTHTTNNFTTNITTLKGQSNSHQQLNVVPPLWGQNRRLSSFVETDSSHGTDSHLGPPPSLGGRKLSILSDTGLSRGRRKSSRSKERAQGLETARTRGNNRHQNHLY